MTAMPIAKYRAFQPIVLPDRQWPSRIIDKAPIWCSVDLRDGNQALIEPMGVDRKNRMFRLLVNMGFKEIEVAFPSSSQTDFDFVRSIIEGGAVPDDVAIQVLTQCRPELIERTFETVKGAKKVILHFYNSTSTLQREVVFRTDRKGVTDIATAAAKQAKALAKASSGTDFQFEYSPESFTGTELDFALEICEAVKDVIGPTPEKKTHPQPAGDGRGGDAEHLRRPVRMVRPPRLGPGERHPVGASAQRPRHGGRRGRARADGGGGTSRGNSVRQRRADRQRRHRHHGAEPVHPGRRSRTRLGRRERDQGRSSSTATSCRCTSGTLTSASSSTPPSPARTRTRSRRASRRRRGDNDPLFQVPYLPIDPKDVGRDYEAVIRINSQSGKGGMAYILRADHGLDLPRSLQIEFSKIAQERMDADGKELTSPELWALFRQAYLLDERASDAGQAADRPDQPRQSRTCRDPAQGGGADVHHRRRGQRPGRRLRRRVEKGVRRRLRLHRLPRACGRPRRQRHRRDLCRDQRRAGPRAAWGRDRPQHRDGLAQGDARRRLRLMRREGRI